MDDGPDNGKDQAVRERNRQFARLGREGEQDVGRKRHEKQNKHNEKKGVHPYTLSKQKKYFYPKVVSTYSMIYTYIANKL